METSDNESVERKRIKNREKVKIHYRKRVKLKHRASRWVRLKKSVKRHRKMIVLTSILAVGVFVAATSVFMTVKQKSDRHKKLMEQKFVRPIGK